jgi:NAD(P)-dependent dehydrogenase (short-subunit alcohol dehydrogenase family)
MTNTSPLFQYLFSLSGKSALITGASGGIGQVLAVALAEAGAAIGVHGRDLTRIKQCCALVEEVGGQAVPLAVDLYEVEDCHKLVAQAHDALGRLDILINCAATNRRKPIAEVTQDDFDTIMAVNLRSVYFLSQAAYPIMRDQGGGKIIHIGSINILYGLDTVSIYGLTKGGLAQLTKVMAVEWAQDNIQVNCVTPGYFLTALSRPLWQDDQKARWFRNRLPVRRPGKPEELVGITLLLASEASSYITGQNIIVDGGFLAGGSWHRDETWSDESLPAPLRKESWFT